MTSQGSGDPGHDFLRAIASFAENNSDKPAAANKPIKMGMVDYDYNPTDFLGGINPRILFDGEATVSEKRYPAMAGYYPLPGARVVLVPIGTTYLIIGSPQTRPLDPKVEYFTIAGTDTWYKPLGARSVRVQVQGSGGAGGGTVATGVSQTSAGSGGAGGAYGESWISANTLSDTVTVTVPGTTVGQVGSVAASSGSTASFGSYVSAAGGGGGGSLAAAGTTQANPGGSAFGQAITADLAISGQGGGSGARLGTQGALGGMGGNSHLGGGGRGLGIQTGTNTGVPGQGYGAGGSGACAGQNAVALLGGDGAQGIVIVTTYF